MFRQYDVVRVRTIPPGGRTRDSWDVNRRPPAAGDVGTIVEILLAEGAVDRYVVECVEPDGRTAWLDDFRAEDLEAAPVPSKSDLPLERLTLHPMASGQSALLLTLRISWDEFPAYAEAVVALLGGRLGTRADGGGERVWAFERSGRTYWITWDDLDPGVSIEPCDAAAGAAIEEIRDQLRQVSA